MSVILKNSGNVTQYTFPSGCDVVGDPFNKRLGTESRVHAHGSAIVSDQKIATRIVSLHGMFGKASSAAMETELNNMRLYCDTASLRLYATQYSDYYFNVECLNFEAEYLGKMTVAEVNIDFLVSDPFRYYKDLTTSSHFVDTALTLNGSGYASIADGSQAGLNMGYSDFMIEVWFKTSYQGGSYQGLVEKISTFGEIGGYDLILRQSDGALRFEINDADTNLVQAFRGSGYHDGSWHYGVMVVDRGSDVGQIYVDGAKVGGDVDISSITASLDNNSSFTIGQYQAAFYGSFDEVRIWNFGKDGLPADYAAYITWRHTHPHDALSGYDSDAWAGYADALRTERITYGALDDDNSDFEGAGADGTSISTNTDWGQYHCSAEIDDEAGSGVNTYNGSDFCCKIHTATGKYPANSLIGANFDAAFTVGEYYELSFDYKVLNCTDARLRIKNAAGTPLDYINLTSTSWDTEHHVFQLLTDADMELNIYSHVGTDETGNEVVWIDNISIKRVGLVAHWKFNGDYTDETTNSNDLTAGGSGNSFDEYIDSATVTNGGNIDVSPIITFTAGASANFSKLTIQNATDSDKYFDYEPAANLTEGDIVVVDCENTTVKLNTVDDIAHFEGAFFELLAGNNSVSVTIVGTVGTNTCAFVFRKRYL